MPDADLPRSAVERSDVDVPAADRAAPVLSMLADDGATCVDGVCALPDQVTR